MISEPGLYTEMSADEYFSDPTQLPSLNQSGIPTLLERSPYHFAFKSPRLNPYGVEPMGEKNQFLGSAVHRLALGRGRDISPIRYPDFRSSSAKAARDLAIANGRIPVLEGELVKAREMAKILKAAIDEACEGHPYQTEVAMFWVEQTQYGPVWCRGMIDVWCETQALALDPKCLSTPATSRAFSRTAADSGYDIQAVFYKRGLEVLRPKLKGRLRFANLVVENTPPYGFQAFELDNASLYVAERQIAQSMEIFAKCLRDRRWPGYPSGIQTFSTPTYYQNQVISR